MSSFDNHKFKICICGHGEHEHEFNFRISTIRQPQIDRKICQYCNCNVLEIIGEFTYKDWKEYQATLGLTPVWYGLQKNE